MLRRLHLSFLLIFFVTVANAKGHTYQNSASLAYKNYAAKTIVDTSYHLIYEDSKTRLYYTEDICDNVPVLKLKTVNLLDVSSSISYKLWADVASKSVSLFAHQELEGTCSLEYKTVLMEAIPTGLTINDIKVSITY